MGCGGSRFESETENLSPRLRPLLRRRFQEIKKHIKVVSETPSKKELLKDANPDQESFTRLLGFDHQSISSKEDELQMESVSVSSIGTTIKPLNKDFKRDHKDDQAAEARKETNIKQESKDEDKYQGEGMASTVEEEDEKREENEEDEENYSSLRSLSEECDGVGSPSFRVYYIESLENIKEEDDMNNGSEKKSISDDRDMTVESLNSNIDSVRKTKKKGKKGSRLRRVIPIGRQAAVKNLLKVKSSCNPACAGNNNASLLEEKKIN
ncbi:hypothetical protein JCGZ_26398 [Jatropha curcas]|uniref:Uncharacterized protein n=1 Tax=Jatropha curcas TaxID=180498 RepID=A0A067JFE8_JATCU|nr:MATH and LRR domain-containing protein PFE0570w [Jatropha curcas]KDP22567.1 hypothetical protein JCGZ_26398 [Jatropha curcas]